MPSVDVHHYCWKFVEGQKRDELCAIFESQRRAARLTADPKTGPRGSPGVANRFPLGGRGYCTLGGQSRGIAAERTRETMGAAGDRFAAATGNR